MSEGVDVQLTPLMRQYNEIKATHRDAILFFRLGDFYEMFGEDAKEASALLNLALTKRVSVPMCGIPYHAARNYINRLLKAGKKVAICEQMAPIPGQKGIVKREVVEILTPGTVIEEGYLEDGDNNFLACVVRNGVDISMSYIDLSTGEFETQSFLYSERQFKLRRELLRVLPKEILIQSNLYEEESIRSILNENDSLLVTVLDEWQVDRKSYYQRLLRQFNTANLKGFGFEEGDSALVACGPLLDYVERNVKSLLPHITSLKRYREESFLGLDESTRRNLELTQNTHDGGRSFTLFSVLNHTRTVGGQRRLHRWISNPLKDINAIEFRLERVHHFFSHPQQTARIREILRSCYDLERLMTRVLMDKTHARDLIAIKFSLIAFLALGEDLKDYQQFFQIPEELNEKLLYIVDLLDSALWEEKDFDINSGHWIREGYSEELDRLRGIKSHAQDFLDRYLSEEKEITQISNLRIRENNVIGYFLEVTNSNKDKVPSHFIRRQTLTNLERYTTDRLIQLESEIKNADQQVQLLQKELFKELCQKVASFHQNIFAVAEMVSDWDAFQALGYCASLNGYCRPQINQSKEIIIKEGRHPVVEKALPAGVFVPNDFTLNNEDISFAMITGPNMAGKSTYLRQVALIVLMAQIGSFVPAASAKIGVVDRIFCRVGASDHLARGESTFLVEMNETAHILRQASDSSLIIMDEIGRGTATIDGLSIAQAVCENLLLRRIKTVFATHFHELTLLDSTAMKNFSLQVAEEGERITFLKKVKEGACGSSYGIHVAQLAGLPSSVVQRAKEILHTLKESEETFTEVRALPSSLRQPTLFSPEEIALSSLRSLDLYNLSPLEVVAEIEKIQRELM